MKLNFPEYTFKVTKEENRYLIWDSIRKKNVVLSPEEWVRQHLIEFLNVEYNYPKSLMQLEKQIIYNNLSKRADLVCYNPNGKIILLAECKAPEVSINENTVNQIALYNKELQVPILLLTNGIVHYVLKLTKGQYTLIKKIPIYGEILSGD